MLYFHDDASRAKHRIYCRFALANETTIGSEHLNKYRCLEPWSLYSSIMKTQSGNTKNTYKNCHPVSLNIKSILLSLSEQAKKHDPHIYFFLYFFGVLF